MKPLTAIILVWGVAYFAKVSGLLDFSWIAFVLPLSVLFCWASLLQKWKIDKTHSTVLLLESVEKKLEETRAAWDQIDKK